MEFLETNYINSDKVSQRIPMFEYKFEKIDTRKIKLYSKNNRSKKITNDIELLKLLSKGYTHFNIMLKILPTTLEVARQCGAIVLTIPRHITKMSQLKKLELHLSRKLGKTPKIPRKYIKLVFKNH